MGGHDGHAARQQGLGRGRGAAGAQQVWEAGGRVALEVHLRLLLEMCRESVKHGGESLDGRGPVVEERADERVCLCVCVWGGLSVSED